MSKTGINWTDLDVLTKAGINWLNFGDMTKVGVNWSDIRVISEVEKEFVNIVTLIANED